MRPFKSIALLVFVLIAPPGCGGGGGGLAIVDGPGGGGIGGTGLTSTGTIDGFGSIFVNGVEFDTAEAEISVNGEASRDDALRLGMVVTVSGTVNDGGSTGVARSVSFDGDVEGPVTAIVAGRDGDSALVTVLGVDVIVERTGTVFDGTSFDALAVNDLVEVSGFHDQQMRLRATRIEKISGFVPGSSKVEVKGAVTGLTQTEFMLDGYVVDFSAADLSRVEGSTLLEGMQVEVRGTLVDTRITAARIDQEEDPGNLFGQGDAINVQGAVTHFSSRALFRVNGLAIDASSAALSPANLVLANGVTVQVQGTWGDGVLVASSVESRRGRVELQAAVASASVGDNTVTLRLFGGSVTVQVDSRTLMNDETGRVSSLRLGDIAAGDFLEVEAVEVGGDLLATRINRDDPDDDVVQAPVERFEQGASITLLGITYGTTGASFENSNDSAITASEFFAELQPGDLVKVKDRKLADGIADEVEFERDEPDRHAEYDDDDESGGDDDDDSGSDSDDDGDEDNGGGDPDEDPNDDTEDEPDDESDDEGGSGSGSEGDSEDGI